MMEQFERVNEALDRLEEMLSGMKAKNDTLCREIAELKGIIEDRDLEIMQLQEDAEKLAAASRAEKEERARYLLDKVNVKDSEDKYPDELSGGMQKRVGIARAIALNPTFLFCDEPNSGLDPETAIVIDHLISSLTKELGITTIMNTHDLNSIMEIGDNIGFLYKGEIIWQGDRHSILSAECPQLREFLCSNTLARNIIEKR